MATTEAIAAVKLSLEGIKEGLSRKVDAAQLRLLASAYYVHADILRVATFGDLLEAGLSTALAFYIVEVTNTGTYLLKPFSLHRPCRRP